ncbi:transposase [Desulfosoma caldarium]|uniref:Transposase n=1 Tax=Desulfosoma caldarium TaxID=610254 RepID=A0A3N1UHN7_9BACT|nr:transposase [Desulfosoma caldarium]ROQ90774.1 transposase [Desulfosoma caldarium]
MEERVAKPVRVQRWTANRKREIVLDILKGHKTIVDVAREHDVKQSEIQQWIDTFIAVGTQALKVHPRSAEAVEQKELTRHREKIGELVLQIEVLKKAEAILSEEESSFYD